MTHDPKIEINYCVEGKCRFSVNASEFDGHVDDQALEEAIRDYADEVVRANFSIYIDNLPRVVAEIRDALRVRKQEDEEENQ